jgi:ribose-phosphate pyrophosphokinase
MQIKNNIMIKLNIVNQENSDIKFLLQNFPDGQKNTVIDLKTIRRTNQEIQILTRLNNFIDLEILICITKCLNNLGFNKLHLYNPMMLGSRSDRKFEEGSNNYLKDVICPIINSLSFNSVTITDPHSQTLEACITNFKEISNQNLVKFAINDILTKI